ncbi:MAG: Fic family protein [Clostridia bacterium]|nr:Fic family protein [Clostridia bacterium]
MENNFEKIQNLLRTKAEFQARLNLIPYEGTVEIKESGERKYLYIRKRDAGKIRSIYVGLYSEELHQILLKGVKDARELKKNIRVIEKELASLGYSQEELAPNVILNMDFARANMKSIIYDQAILEGISTTFPDTETIIENGKVNNVSAEDVQKILNLKHAWEFVLDKDVIQAASNYYVCQYIAKLVNEGFYQEGGRIRGVPVKIGGSSYIPPLPIESAVKEKIDNILSSSEDHVEIAIELALYVMKTQIFNDGNKRTAIIFANHYLVAHGAGLMVIPENLVTEFKKLLVEYYEGRDNHAIKLFLKEKCLSCLTRIERE